MVRGAESHYRPLMLTKRLCKTICDNPVTTQAIRSVRSEETNMYLLTMLNRTTYSLMDLPFFDLLQEVYQGSKKVHWVQTRYGLRFPKFVFLILVCCQEIGPASIWNRGHIERPGICWIDVIEIFTLKVLSVSFSPPSLRCMLVFIGSRCVMTYHDLLIC